MNSLVHPAGDDTRSPQQSPSQSVYLQPERAPHLLDYWRVILTRRWVVLACFATIATAATIYTFSVTPTYRATATIKIDPERPQILSFQEVGSPPPSSSSAEFLNTQQKLLQTRSLSRRVIEHLEATGQPAATTAPSSLAETWRAMLTTITAWFNGRQTVPDNQPHSGEPRQSGSVDALLQMLTVEPIRTSNLVKIAFTTSSPQFSALLANTWAQAFIDQSLEMKYNATAQAGEWLAKQQQDVLGKLEQSEAKLHEFAKQKEILTIGEKKDIVTTKLADLSEALTKAQGERMAKEALYHQSQGKGFESIPVVLENPLISGLKTEYYKLDSEYQRLSQTYKPGYPKMGRMREGIAQTKRRLDTEIRRIVEAIEQEYGAAAKKEKLLQTAVEDQKRLAIKLNQDFIQYDILKGEVDTNRQIYTGILERQKQAGVSQGLAASNIQIVDQAEVLAIPFSPNRTRNLLLGIVLGLTVGIGMAFFFDYLDNTIKNPDDVERAFGIPNLALIPSLASATPRHLRAQLSGNGHHPFALVAHSDSRSALTEAFRSLRTSLLFSSPNSPPTSILFTSALPAEGKTGLSINTAITLAQLGNNVLLIDGDMRRPTCHGLLDLPATPGLSDYLTGNADLASIIRPTAVPHLHCVSAGTIPINPAELLASPRMRATLAGFAQAFNHIVIDAPPLLGLADGGILATMVEGVILVVHAEQTPREAIQQALKPLIELHARLLGVVLNQVNVRLNGYSHYYTHYTYHRDPNAQTSINSQARELPPSGGRENARSSLE